MDDDDLYLAVLPNIIGSGWDGSGSVCLDVFVVLSVCVCVCARVITNTCIFICLLNIYVYGTL